jgi:hypothetical protein
VNAPRLFVHPRSDRELALFLREDLVRDQIIFAFHRDGSLRADLRSFPLDDRIFLRSPSDLHCLINHRCAASTYVDWRGCYLRALRDLRGGDELTLNYLTIYDVMANPFVCHCGDAECYREIRGFRYLPLEQKLKIELYLSPYLRHLLEREVSALRGEVI